MKLYSFFRSGTSHRLRIALKLKGLSYDYEAVDLRREQHLDAAYEALHPQGLVPALQTDGEDGRGHRKGHSTIVANTCMPAEMVGPLRRAAVAAPPPELSDV